jgi:hypothetical protein
MIGMISGKFLMKNRLGVWVWASFIGTVLYGTVAFCFSHAEYRLTIPFYPVVLSLSAFGIGFVVSAIKKNLHKNY